MTCKSVAFAILIQIACFGAFAQDVQPGTLVSGQAVSNPQGVVVVQNNGARGKCHQCPATKTAPPAPAPLPPIPPGFVVVQSNYLEQVSATAQAAIDSGKSNLEQVSATAQSAIKSAQSNEESLVGILKVVGIALSAIAVLLTFFGFQEYKRWTETKAQLFNNLAESERKLTEVEKLKNEVVPRLESSLWEMQELTSILLDMHQLSIKIDEVENLLKGNNTVELQRVATLALRPGRELFERAEKLLERRTQSAQSPDQSQTAAIQRILGYIVATLCIFSMRAESLDDAVSWAEKSLKFNPMKYDDREYNYACALSKRYAKQRSPSDKEAALRVLEMGMNSGVWTWREIWDDDDFNALDEDLLKSRFVDQPYADLNPKPKKQG
jgi:tetratricopeptide (TPR) repeat protein